MLDDSIHKSFFDFFRNPTPSNDDFSQKDSFIDFFEENSNNDKNKSIVNNISGTQRRTYKEKKEKIKFLLSKRNHNEVKSVEVMENKNELILKKEKLKQKNREASQKSREKKKAQLLNLINENHKLRLELDQFTTKINQLCKNCKCMFEHDNSCGGTGLDNNDQIYIEDTHISTHNSTSTYSKHKEISFMISGLFCIILIFLMFSNSGGIEFNHKHPTLRNTNQIIKYYDHSINNKAASNDDKKYMSVKKYPQILIDDSHNQKSYYINFEDYYQLQNTNFEMCQNTNFYYKYKQKKTNKTQHNNSTNSKSNKYFNSVYFKMFVPLCNSVNEENNNKTKYDNFTNNHYDFFFLGNSDKNYSPMEQNQELYNQTNKDFYYEVECKVMNFTKLIKSFK